ncbi:MAG TPA: heme ABC exporter ATP-binding protein CcmA [Candidatus Krumholzibacteria bacterium]|nr:heme ABC exporter ATP-binding protein CcmA [Candidatus Krumholzibacteria bacterium]
MNFVLQARGLSRRYGRSWALKKVDLELSAGESVALLGANGAGKSTLLTLLATLHRPTEGQLRIFDLDPHQHSERIRRRIGYVAHATLLDDALTARENLLYYGALFGLAQLGSLADQALAQVELEHRAHDRVGGFSRGMRQRLSLARALLHDPDLLILDEPFTGLDAAGCRDLAGRLRQEKQKGRAIILATHQLERVLSWSDRALILHRGRKVEESEATTHDAAGWAVHLSKIAEARA